MTNTDLKWKRGDYRTPWTADVPFGRYIIRRVTRSYGRGDDFEAVYVTIEAGERIIRRLVRHTLRTAKEAARRDYMERAP
jgi:hypothetical protein